MKKPFIHSTSIVEKPCELGAGVKIWHFCHVSSHTRLGRGVSLGQNVYIAPEVTLGDFTRVQNNVSLYKGVVCEQNVFIGPSVVFTNVKYPRAHVSRKKSFQTTLVCEGASIGANATIVCGLKIGRFAMIGAGAVVTRDVPPFALMIGTPASLVGFVCACGEKLSLLPNDSFPREAICSYCDAAYRYEKENVLRQTHL